MIILATFDGSKHAESTLPIISRMAALPDAEIVLLAVAHEPQGRRQRGVRRTIIAGGFPPATPIVLEPPPPQFVERKDQAIERERSSLEDYLLGLAGGLAEGTKVHVEAHVADDAAKMIIECAAEEHADVIVMATHGRSGVSHLLFGSTTEEVIRSSVAPVLVVHPPKA